MSERPNILVVCGKNKRRSRTAEYIFKNDQRFHIRSVGLSPKSDRQIKERDLEWSDLVLVMERKQSSRITETFRQLKLPPMEVLYIEDDYDYLQTELIELLKERINSILGTSYEI